MLKPHDPMIQCPILHFAMFESMDVHDSLDVVLFPIFQHKMVKARLGRRTERTAQSQNV